MIQVIFYGILQVVNGIIDIFLILFTNIIYIFWDEQMTLFGLLILIGVAIPIILYALNVVWSLITGFSFTSWNVQRKLKSGDLKIKQTGHIFGKKGLKVKIEEKTNKFW